MQLENKVIVVTGGTSGIGKALVDKLAGNNFLIVIGHNQHRLSELEQTYPKVATYLCNLESADQVETTADQIIKQHPRVDALINNAAIQHTPAFLDDDFRFETIAQEVNTNFLSVCLLIYGLLPSLLHDEQQALILNVNSALALAPKTHSAIYCATKGALNILSWSLRYQFEPTNIKVLQAMLPLVDTQMTAGRGQGKLTPVQAATELISGMEKEIKEHYIGKTKWLRLIYRLSPALARRILKQY